MWHCRIGASAPLTRTVATIACSAALAGLALLPQDAQAGDTRAVVELFTSQGCSSCPPADKLIGELAKDPGVIALSLAIDYWDYLGWKDTLAIPGHSSRQKAYSRARGDRQVYTPQAVVNGMMQVLGSDRAAIGRAVEQTQKDPRTLSVPVTLSVADGQVNVSAAAKDGGGRGEVWLCPLSHAVPVVIGRGENRGHTITYHNIVRRWIKLGEWTGSAGSWSIPLKDIRAKGVDGIAVVVQSGTAQSPGPMLGAALAGLE